MPPVRSISCSADLIEILDQFGIKNLNGQLIPPAQNTPAKVENWVNTVWIPANIVGYQMRVHVFSISPVIATVGTWNLGETIDPNWWS